VSSHNYNSNIDGLIFETNIYDRVSVRTTNI
jgi:hypothetical protein